MFLGGVMLYFVNKKEAVRKVIFGQPLRIKK